MQNKIKDIKLVWKRKTFSIMDLLLCVFFIVVCDFIGYLGTFFQKESLKVWYPMLTKSEFTPPSFVFSFVWGILYALIGFATFLAFKKSGRDMKKSVLFIFFLQLGFNLLWNIFFFGMRTPLFAFIEILFLLIIVVNMMQLYRKVSLASYLLLLPYFFWLLFAIYLNFFIVVENLGWKGSYKKLG